MKRMIAAFAVMGLAIAVAIYVAMAPLASATATGSLNSVLALFDSGVDRIEAAFGRSTGALIAIGVGLVLSLGIGLFPTRRSEDADTQDLDDDEQPEFLVTPQEAALPPSAPYEPAPSTARDELEEATAQRLAHLRNRASQWSEADVPATDSAASPEPVSDAEQVLVAPTPQPPEAQPFAKPATHAFTPVPLVRKPRDPQRDWFADSSWFGGLPRLGSASWPTDATGTPLPFLAQIDLATLAAAAPQMPLPDVGAIAFFLGDGGVVPVPHGSHDFTEPPADLPPAFDEGGPLLPRRTTPLTRWLFPYWPIDIGTHFAPSGHEPLARDHPFFAVGVGAPVETLWWHSVMHFAQRLHDALETADTPIAARREQLHALRQALARIEADPDADPYERDDTREDVEGAEAELARIEEQRQALPEMLSALDSFLEGRTPWSLLTTEEREVMRDLLPETHERYGELVGNAIPASLAEMATISLRAAISGPPEAVAAIPPETLARMNNEYRLPPESLHQLFLEIPETGELILLDLAWDDMVEWTWPDEGHFQLRLSRDDALSGNWAAAQAVFVSY